MKVSARNVWAGVVAKIDKGAVNSVVTVAMKGGDTVVAVITDNRIIAFCLFFVEFSLAISGR